LLHGGGQETGLRSGTLNVPGIIGFGEAAALALRCMPQERVALRMLRDDLHAALSARSPHSPLIDQDLFELAQQILADRGEDHSHRAAKASEYLLAGLLFCEHSGKRFVGTAAHGNRYRYRYYTCFSRQRYGPKACSAERLPADQLETAVLRALLETYRRADLLTQAIAGAAERYLLAFEAGTMPESQCGPRIRTLGAKAAELRARQSELAELIMSAEATNPSQEQLDEVRDRINDTIESGEANAQKGLLQNLVAEIQVAGRNSIKPCFRVPMGPLPDNKPISPREEKKVRTPSGSVPPTGFEPATFRSGGERSIP
jgi:site-specific DNA recombinase